MRRHRGRDRHRTCISQFAEGAPTRAARRRVRARGPLREQRLPSTAGRALLCTLPEAGGKRTYDAMTCALARSIVISPALERVLWRTMLCRVCSADEQRQRHTDRTPTPVTSGDVQEPRRTLGDLTGLTVSVDAHLGRIQRKCRNGSAGETRLAQRSGCQAQMTGAIIYDATSIA